MSQNRAVQAAQRRRAGGPEPAAPGRGPQPSINSSQLFSQGQQGQQGQGQMRPGTNTTATNAATDETTDV